MNVNGILIYIVCSFLKDEGEKQIKKFMNENNNFSIEKFSNKQLVFFKKFITNKGFFYTIPSKLENGVLVDGFFSAKLIKDA